MSKPSKGSLVREDEQGLFIKTGGYQFRPGNVTGYDHAYRMDAGGLKPGDYVTARHIGGSPIARITLADGTNIHWHSTDA